MTQNNFTYRRTAADKVFSLAERAFQSGFHNYISEPPKKGWVMGGTGFYCLPDKIYEALQYYEIAIEICPSATFFRMKAFALETLLDFPLAFKAYQDLEKWVKENEESNESDIKNAREGRARCQGKPKGTFSVSLKSRTSRPANLIADDTPENESSEDKEKQVDAVAIKFVTALINRDYSLAYSMTTAAFKKHANLRDLQKQFEHSCPPDYGEFDIPEILNTTEEWPGKAKNDICWIYIVIGGQTNEAVSVLVAQEGKNLKISEVDVGRP
jgi:hypothetical protein